MTTFTNDPQYLDIFLTPIRVSAQYKPKFGKAGKDGVALQFMTTYGADPFYRWIGFDSPRLYAAHKAAGGITSLYRQLGIGSERLIRQIIADTLGLTDEQVRWRYVITKEDGKQATLSLDARITTDEVDDDSARVRIQAWLKQCGGSLGLLDERTTALRGAVFEIRQGYKSADSKRQNADLRNALHAYNQNYLPVMLIMSTQINDMVYRRYNASQMIVLTGVLDDDPIRSTYAFLEQVVGYSLTGFFERNHLAIQHEVSTILESLLSST